MNNQISLIWSLALLVFLAGCSQPDPQSGTQTRSSLPGGQDPAPGRMDGNAPGLPVDNDESVTKTVNPVTAGGARRLERERGMSRQQSYDSATVQPSAPAEYFHKAMPGPDIRWPADPLDRDNYAHFDDNPVKRVSEQPVSTFSIDVDTGSYAVVRRMLNTGQLPRQDVVRSEELINYFSYDYPVQAERTAPFALYKEIAPTPWNPDTLLLHIGLKAVDQDRAGLPASNLVFLIDVSGSMQDPNKLALLKTSMKLLTRELREQDKVSIVVYAGASGVVLEPTSGRDKFEITTALDRLQAGGSTNGADGIRLAYALAEQAYIEDGINRVLLATEGDFNVGTVDIEQLKDLVEEKRKSGIALSTLGFGAGNYNDALMEQIADIGNGNYAYIDTLNEARKVLVEEMSSTLLTVARDVKIQIEFNPAVVSEYRLIGYENRILNREDFNNDKVDAGDIGAGHTVTALYEIALSGSRGVKMDPLRYQDEIPDAGGVDEIAFLRLRYKAPDGDTSRLLEWAVARDEISAGEDTSPTFRHAAAVAAFGQILRGGEHLGGYAWQDILALARSARGTDPDGYRGEFLGMIRLAESLQTPVARN